MDKIAHMIRTFKRYALLLPLMFAGFTLQAELSPVCNDKGKWGYENADGRLIIKHKFNGASQFKDGSAMVLNGKKYGLIDEAGQFLLKAEYDMIGEFNALGLAEVIKGNRHGFVNRKGCFIIPCKYQFVGAFNTNGLIWVNEGGKLVKGNITGGKFSVYRSDGTLFFDRPYAFIGQFVRWQSKYTAEQLQKLSITEQNLTKGANYHYWKKASIAFRPGMPLDSNIHAYCVADNNRSQYNGIYSNDGTMLVPTGKYWHVSYPDEGIAVVYPKSGKANFLDVKSGKLLLANDIDDCWGFNGGYGIGIVGGLHYIYDITGVQRSSGYTKIYPENNGVLVVRNGTDKYGLIARNGIELIPATNYSVYPCIEGLVMVKQKSSSQIGYVDNTGKWVIDPQYASGNSFSGGHAIVKTDSFFGMIDKDNNIIMPFEYTNLYHKHSPQQTLIWGKKSSDTKFSCYDLAQQKTIVGPICVEAFPFDRFIDGLALIKKTTNDSSWGWIDKSGNEVIPCIFTQLHAAKAGDEYINSGKSPWTEFKTFIFNLHNNRTPVDLKSTVKEELWDY